MPRSRATIFAAFPLTAFLPPPLHFSSPLLSPLLLPHLCQRTPQTKQQRDHTKRRQSVENQAPYREHINNKACGTHLRRAPSHLHVPLIYIFTKRPLWLSPHQQKPSPQPHQHTPGLTKGRQAGRKRVPAETTRAHQDNAQTHATHKINFCTRSIQMCNGRVNREIRKRVSEIWRCESWPCSSNFHPSSPSLPSSPPPPLLSSLSSHHQVPGDEQPVIIHSL